MSGYTSRFDLLDLLHDITDDSKEGCKHAILNSFKLNIVITERKVIGLKQFHSVKSMIVEYVV
jgi:hypothetical protein